MKLTPEQKAFLEYGKAIATLEYRIERIRFTARMLFKREYRELSLRFRGGLRDDFELYYAIGDVRRKRAACRAWQRRRCETCLHRDDEIPYTCDMCSRSPYAADNWEPRKEGE
ncbi:hypothetical protein [Akkermansia sp.]|uniref:hypothetical protein n=1 Tax=Akkermansia sp. TaxID=1872421 RepID=UPI002E769BD0|nr:hypothetical protein [Akkermansia sp.]